MATKPELTSMTVSLPTSQKDYVRSRAVASGCSTPSEYIRRLIHADECARELEELENRVLQGMASPAREMSPDAWRDLRSTLRKTAAKRRRPHTASR